MLLPSIAGWFFNFSMAAATKTRRGHAPQYEIDPFVFSIAKMLIAWLVYTPLGWRFFGVVSEYTVATVQQAMPAGTWGMVVSGAVGAAASLYEAVLRK